jgi:hypothetical protein
MKERSHRPYGQPSIPESATRFSASSREVAGLEPFDMFADGSIDRVENENGDERDPYPLYGRNRIVCFPNRSRIIDVWIS